MTRRTVTVVQTVEPPIDLHDQRFYNHRAANLVALSSRLVHLRQ